MKIENNINKLFEDLEKEYNKFYYAFISLGKPNMKAKVKLVKNSNNLKRNTINECEKFKKKTGEYPKWIKVDVVTEQKNISFQELKSEMINTRRNYIDFGIVLDENWDLSFLPEEINANAFVRPIKGQSTFILSENNINNYIKKYTNLKKVFNAEKYENKTVTKFYTQGYILDKDTVYELGDRGYTKNLRKVDNLSQEIDLLLINSTTYLKGEIQSNGKYIYGYFPHFDKRIGFYNNLRHSSSTYALIEGLEYLNKDISIAEKAIDYLINNYTIEDHEGAGYIFDDTNDSNEIKLGQNAAFIFSVCEYLKHNPARKDYLKHAQKIANGVLKMIDKDTAETTHVLNYPSLSIKEEFRVVYYDGEAALALLRLYQIDNNKIWLDNVKLLFDRFIKMEYWKYHDHWLGYCTNELVKITPSEELFKLGINNVASYLDYIYHRETTFPTFLEMLMSTYHLIQKAKSSGYEYLVNNNIDEDKLIKTIHKRADYERTGFFYPEIAMYFKNPRRVLGTFFIKHHGYRVRIDDVEHYISGYVQYQKVFKGKF